MAAEKPTNLFENDLDPEVVKKEWLTPKKSPKPMDEDLTLAQLSKFKTPCPSTPSSSSLGKRRKSKQKEDELSPTTKKNFSSSKFKIVIRDPASTCLSFKREKATATKGIDTPAQARSPTMIRAEEVQSSLGSEHPSITKLLVRSHVGSCFWMGLPTPFCKSFLPKNDTTMVLEDESSELFEVKYIAYKTGLSAGWKKFSVQHNLLEGDVLIFHLVGSHKFKVYIIRARDMTEVDGALSLLTLEARTKQTDADNTGTVTTPPQIKKQKRQEALPLTVTTPPQIKKRKRQKSLPLTVVQKKQKKQSPLRSVPQDSEEVGLEVLEGSRTFKAACSFQEIKSFEEFHIVVDGLCIDSELSEQVRMNYYELCLSKKEFLHELLPKNVYYKLVAGMIGETVSIANDIRAIQLTTTREEFKVWEKSLKSFELLGMKVGFLRDRLNTLLSLAFESEGALDTKRYMEAKTEQSRTEDEIRKFEEKLVELKEASSKFDGVIKTLKQKAERYELKFQEEVNAPW